MLADAEQVDVISVHIVSVVIEQQAAVFRQACESHTDPQHHLPKDPMPGLWRTRVASFFAGSGLTALLAFGILRQDLQRQFGTLGEQARS